MALALKTSETRFITPIRAAVPFINIFAAISPRDRAEIVGPGTRLDGGRARATSRNPPYAVSRIASYSVGPPAMGGASLTSAGFVGPFPPFPPIS